MGVLRRLERSVYSSHHASQKAKRSAYQEKGSTIEMKMADKRSSGWATVEQIQTGVRRHCRPDGSLAEDLPRMARQEEAHSSVNISWPPSSHPVTDIEKKLDASDLVLKDTSFGYMDLHLPLQYLHHPCTRASLVGWLQERRLKIVTGRVQ